MGEGAALLAAVVADPAEVTLRLVYADWLDEYGMSGAAWRTQSPPRRFADDGDDGGGYGDGDGYGGYGGYGGDGYDGGSGDGGGYGGYGGSGGGYGDDDGGGYGDGGGDGGDYAGGDGGDYGGGGGDGYGGEPVMPAIGDAVFLHAQGSFYPYAWCGRVVEILAPDAFKLADASLLPHTRESGVTWGAVAAGDPVARAAVRVRRRANPVEVYRVCNLEPWVGDLPTKDQH